MNCSKIIKHLSAYSDDEASPALAAQISNHLSTCSSCQKELVRLQSVYRFIDSGPILQSDPYMAARIKSRLISDPGIGSRPFLALLQQSLAPAVIVAGLAIGILLGAQLHNVLRQKQPVMAQHRTKVEQIDANMFMPTPDGSLTGAYISLTSTTE